MGQRMMQNGQWRNVIMIGAATYSAGLMSQSFWFLEFKKAVRLRQEGLDYDEIKKIVILKNRNHPMNL